MMPPTTNPSPRPARLAASLRSRVSGKAEGGDAGYVMVMLALTFTLLMAFAGYSVDVGNWNFKANEASTAAEAAALGGVAFLPDDSNAAIATAEQIARNHGYVDAEISAVVGDAPNKLEVTITEQVPTYFVRVLGFTNKEIKEKSVAEFAQPVEMGSPTIILGNDPDAGYSPDYWLSIASRNVLKDLGDRFTTRRCSYGTAGCSGSWNSEYDATGHKFAVRVVDPTQPLRIQVFDPAWVWSGSDCTIPTHPTAADIAYLQTLDDGSRPNIPVGYYDNAATRYAGGNTSYCTGDDRPGSSGPATRYSVALPDTTPWDDNDNTELTLSTCKPETFSAYSPTNPYGPPTVSIYEYLNPDDSVGDVQWKVNATDGLLTFAETYRRWVTVCEIPVGPWLVEGDYIVKVSTPGSSAGQNRFSLRAGPPSGSGGVLDVGQSTYARGRFPVYANTNDADIQFFLARVPPSADERLLRVTFFDIGDSSSAGSLTVVPPLDSNMAQFNTCDVSRTDGAALTIGAGCVLSNVWDSNGYGSQTVTIDVTIPPTYSCDFTVADNCWVTVRAQFPGGITDATTWTAQLVGDAVRLVSD